MKRINQFFSKGVLPTHNSIEAKRIVICNITNALCFFICLVMSIFLTIISFYPLNVVFIVAGICYVIIYKILVSGYTSAAKSILFYIILIHALFISIVIGTHGDVNNFYIPIAIIPFLIFGQKERKLFYLSLVLAMLNIILVYSTQELYTPIHNYSAETYKTINSVINLISIGCMITLCFLFLHLTEFGELELLILNNKLKLAKEEQERMNILKDHLFGIISHDLRSPINVIHGLTDLIINNQLSKEEENMLAERLKQSADNTNQLLDNLLNWSELQIKNNSDLPKIELIKIRDLIDQVFKQLQTKAGEKNITLINHIDNNICLEGDPGMLEIVIRNLITNSIKFSYTNQQVIVEAEKKQNKIIIHVEDNGIGIPKEILPKLFTKDKSVSREGTFMEKGSGIGLLLCKHLIESNGGTISVKSIPRKQTIFSLELVNLSNKDNCLA